MVFHYNKLIRDNVPDIIHRHGGKLAFHRAKTDEEYWLKLKEKLQEELNKFGEREDIESFANVMEIIDMISSFMNFDRREIGAIQENKEIEFGKYKNRYILDSSDTEIKE